MILGRITVTSQEELVDVTRMLNQAGNSLRFNPELSDIEQTAITNLLCGIRDFISLEGSG